MNTPNKTCKGVFLKILFALGIVFVVLLCTVIFTVMTKKPIDLKISNVDMTNIGDGNYIGSADNGLVKATVSVEVSKGIIQKIMLLEHEHLLGKPAEKIIDSIVQQQSLEVDAITSATYSSDTLRKAVENALRQGE